VFSSRYFSIPVYVYLSRLFGPELVNVGDDWGDFALGLGLGQNRCMSGDSLDLNVSLVPSHKLYTHSVEAVQVFVASDLEDGGGTLSRDASN